VAREADVAIRNVPPAQQSLVSRRVALLGGCVYASPLYLERRGIPTGVEDVPHHDVVAYESLGGMPGFEWLRDPERGGHIVFRADDPAALASAASAGLGLAAIPCLIGDVETGRVPVPALGFSTTPIYVVTHEQIRGTARVRAVLKFVEELMERNRATVEGGHARGPEP
jgi:DNA-binding transcriptional LysR family regulator